ncbi:MAG: protein kinase, partial [Pirellulales bacterium]
GRKGSPRGTLANRVKADMPPLAVSSDFAALVEVVAKMTARDPSLRYPTAVEAADALSTCIGRSTESLEPRPESISKDSSSDKVDMPSNGLQRLGGYRFLQPLGSGAMANVYLAEQESLSRHVAVKVLRPETVARGGAVERFTREARAAAALIHGNIVQIHEVGCIDDVHFIVQEYVAGPSLRSWLEHRGPLNAMQALTVLGDVGSALTRAAQQGVVHRDIKPENLLLTREGEVKVADFGLARIHEQDLSLTQDGTTLGTPLYMSPEQAEGREVDTRSDLYSLGATVYHLLSGRPPFGGATLIAVAMSHIRDELVPIESLRPDLPEALTSMLGKLLSKQVNQRYQNASELVQDVETVAMAVAGGSRRGDSPLAWDGDLDQWASGGGEAATTEMRSLQAPKHSDQRSGIANEPSPIVPLIDTSSEKKPGQKKPDRKRGRGRRAKQKQSSNRIGLWTTAGLLGVAGVGLIALVLVLFQTKTTSNEGDSKQPEQQGISNLDNLTSSKGSKSLPKNVDTTSQSDQSNVNRDQPVPTTVRRSRAELVDSDSLPWGSPTSGKPPSLAYLPLGAQLILLVRPADLVESEEGELFLKALGPFVSQSLGMLEKVSGNSLDQIETVQAGWRADDNGSAVGGYAIWLKDSANEKKIINAFGGMTSKKEGSETVYSSSQLSIWLPSLEKGRLVVCGAPSEVESILKTSAGIGPVGDSSEIQAILTRDMEQLVGMLDRTRHISLFGSPQYLRSEGRDVLTGSLANLVDPLKVFFSDAVRSAALSLHVGDKMYVELDVMSSVDERASVMAKNIMKKIGALATDVEDWTAGLVGLQYGRKIVNRLPGMIRILAASTRAGAEGKGVVVNAYLPEHAGHNIALAAELALAQAGGTSPSVMVSAQSGGGPSKPLSAQEKLQQKTSLSFPRDTLEKSIQLIAEDINLTIEILGNDLKLEGITKNQSFGLDEKEKTADEIIRAILIKANPDGKLVYIFRGQGENESLVITTRASAGERGDTIPPVFSSPTK